MASSPETPRISIVIVNYKVPEEICQLLSSLREADHYGESEVIVVDNASLDHSQETVCSKFPEIAWISLKSNIGFGKACNIAAQKARGDYILFINPDTLVSLNTLQICLEFMEAHPEVGIMGPKIIKPDGTFQPHCRRSFPTPLSAFAYMLGLSRLFPRNSSLGHYNLTHISPDISMEVDAISGSFMFMHLSLFKKLGGFDELFFMYGEDLDICARCRDAGYKVWYHPVTQIIHFKGKSSTKNLIRARTAFYEAMIIFSRKYRHTYGAFFPGWFLMLGIIFFSVVNIGTIWIKSLKACFIDLSIINILLWVTTYLRFMVDLSSNPYQEENLLFSIGMHVILSLCFLLTFAYRGVYSTERYSFRNTLISGSIASLLFYSGLFFIKSMAFSRIAFSVAAILITFSLAAWREFLPTVITYFRRGIYTTGRVIIAGNTFIAASLIKAMEQDKTAQICGIVWPHTDIQNVPAAFEGYQVLGSFNTITAILQKQKADLLLIAIHESWYSYIIEALSQLQLKHLSIQWVPKELFNKPPDQLPQPIPLKNFSV